MAKPEGGLDCIGYFLFLYTLLLAWCKHGWKRGWLTRGKEEGDSRTLFHCSFSFLQEGSS